MPEPEAPRLRPPERPTAAPLADPAMEGKSRKDPAGDQALRYEIARVVPDGARPRATVGEDLEQMMDRGAWNVDTVAAAMSDADMSVLRPGVRSRLVAYIGGGYLVGDEDEETIVRLLSTAPATDAAAILADLRRDHAAILRRLESAIDGAEYAKYHEGLRRMYFAAMEPKEAARRMETAPELPWADPGLPKALWGPRFVYDPVRFTEAGNIALTWYSKGDIGPITSVRHTAVLDPLQMVNVRFHRADPELGGAAGQVVALPAISLAAMVNKQLGRDYWRAAELGMMAGGVGELGAGSRLTRVLAGIDLVVGAAGMVIDDYRSEIAGSEHGPQLLRVWDVIHTLYMAYGIVRILASLPKIFIQLRDALRLWRASGARALDPKAAADIGREVEEVLREADKAGSGTAAAETTPAASESAGTTTGPVPETVEPPASEVSPAAVPQTGAQLQTQLGEADAALRSAPSASVFSLGEMVDKGANFNTIAKHLKQVRQEIIAAGGADPFPHGLNETILKMDTIGFIFQDAALQAEWVRLKLALEGLRSPIIRNSAEYRALPDSYRRLGPEGKMELLGNFEEFFQGKVGRRVPDIADFWLDAHRPQVLSDVTANVNRLFHNFKTRFYAEVLSRLTGLPVEAWEFSSRAAKKLR